MNGRQQNPSIAAITTWVKFTKINTRQHTTRRRRVTLPQQKPQVGLHSNSFPGHHRRRRQFLSSVLSSGDIIPSHSPDNINSIKKYNRSNHPVNSHRREADYYCQPEIRRILRSVDIFHVVVECHREMGRAPGQISPDKRSGAASDYGLTKSST